MAGVRGTEIYYYFLWAKLGHIVFCILNLIKKFKDCKFFYSDCLLSKYCLPWEKEPFSIQMRTIVFENLLQSQTGQMFLKMNCLNTTQNKNTKKLEFKRKQFTILNLLFLKTARIVAGLFGVGVMSDVYWVFFLKQKHFKSRCSLGNNLGLILPENTDTITLYHVDLFILGDHCESFTF